MGAGLVAVPTGAGPPVSDGDTANGTFSGLNQTVPFTVVKSSKSASWQMYLKKVFCEPGHTQCARSLTRVNSAQRTTSVGQVTLISNDVRGASTGSRSVPTLTVP